METWTKEEWANSYKGSVLTSDGSEVITDQEINTKVGDLEQKLQANTAAIIDKFISRDNAEKIPNVITTS